MSHFPSNEERNRHSWPGDNSFVPLPSGDVDMAAWCAMSRAFAAIDPSHSQAGDSITTGSLSQGTSHSGTEAGEHEQSLLREKPPPSDDGRSPPTSNVASSTPNAKASRLFRERRKEREKILRETVAELAERNAALEGLLLHHGIASPPAATLRHDLSLHRSQRLGGPPIHISGLTAVKQLQIPPFKDPRSQHGRSAICGPQSSAVLETPSASQRSSGTAFVPSSRLEEQPHPGQMGMHVPFPMNLSPVSDASRRSSDPLRSALPDYACSSRLPIVAQPAQVKLEDVSMEFGRLSHPVTGCPIHRQQPAPSKTSNSIAGLRSAALTSPIDLYRSSSHGPLDGIYDHIQTPSGSIASLPVLTSEERRILVARGGYLPGSNGFQSHSGRGNTC
nr:hypothetical protein BN887_04395 [Melanopsichium pennsylvanicum 4]